MTDLRLRILFLSAVVLVCAVAAWFDVAEAVGVCPIPDVLLGADKHPPPCFEFWLSRYQTLAAGILAVGAALYATLPAWRQLDLLKRQVAAQIRERLAGRYRMIDEILSALDQMSRAPQHDQRLDATGQTLADFDRIKPIYLAAYASRKNSLEQMLSALNSLQMGETEHKIVDPAVQGIKMRYDECDEALVGLANQRPIDDPIEIQKILSPLWFYCIDYPDMMVTSQLHAVRKAFDQIKAEIVGGLVAPTPEK